jgi:geranylgeranyl diphosphate synthase, type II
MIHSEDSLSHGITVLHASGDTDDARLASLYREMLPLSPGLEAGLHSVLRHTVEHPGGLSRAKLAHGLLLAFGGTATDAARIAIAIEYWHSASLILDDLPCMDDASERRGATCAHVNAGEASAILGALALINRSYAMVWQVLGQCPPFVRAAAGALVESTLGTAGVLDGQARDLAHAARPHDATEILAVADGKTGALMRLTLQLPALVANVADSPRQEALESLALAWGRVYQIIDDFKDCGLAGAGAGKTAGRDLALGHPNLVVQEGRSGALEHLQRELARARAALAQLDRDPAAASLLRQWQTRFEVQTALIQSRHTASPRA